MSFSRVGSLSNNLCALSSLEEKTNEEGLSDSDSVNTSFEDGFNTNYGDLFLKSEAEKFRDTVGCRVKKIIKDLLKKYDYMESDLSSRKQYVSLELEAYRKDFEEKLFLIECRMNEYQEVSKTFKLGVSELELESFLEEVQIPKSVPNILVFKDIGIPNEDRDIPISGKKDFTVMRELYSGYTEGLSQLYKRISSLFSKLIEIS